jgi:hypothetical protein
VRGHNLCAVISWYEKEYSAINNLILFGDDVLRKKTGRGHSIYKITRQVGSNKNGNR